MRRSRSCASATSTALVAAERPRLAIESARPSIGRSMRTLAILLIIGVAAWYGYGRYGNRFVDAHIGPARSGAAGSVPDRGARSEGRFRCDGRIYCSQMTSCAEATYFLRNCPGVKMDGDHDGIPCERQWCG
ncbi:MAG: excalibur calcium-binding domain-containing protein [Burkholderiales bacterium]